MEIETNKKYQRPKCPHNKFKARCIECGEHKSFNNFVFTIL
jgi:hypothetical protein